MNFGTLCEWLKTTIPGIIILGTVGSLIAAFIIICLKIILAILSRFFSIVLPQKTKDALNKIRKRISFEIYKYGYEYGIMAGTDRIWGSIVYFSAHSVLCLIWLIIGISLFISGVFVFVSIGNCFVGFGSLALIVTSFLCFYKSFRHLFPILYAFKNFPYIAEHDREARKKMQQKHGDTSNADNFETQIK
jgi:hypothetical protein